MVPMVARHLICPLHELLLGRRTFRYLRELEWSQLCSPEELRHLQRMKLRDLLRHAGKQTPFYRTRFHEAGVDPETGDPLELLSSLPLLSKVDIRANLDDMLWHDVPGGLFEFNTGGSTGEPLIFYFDRRRQGYDQAARIRTHRWFGVDVGDRELYLWGSPIEWKRRDGVKRFRDRMFNHRLLSAFHMSPKRMDRYLDELHNYKPACVFGYPSSIALLVEHARSRGRRVDSPRLRAVFVTGEVCYPHHRQVIEEFFQVPVADCYGSREGGFIAHQCPEGNFHITSENLIVEIVEDGLPVQPGHSGEIVITHLDSQAMPFIRYRTGDVGRLKPGRCRCGRGLGLMDIVKGRTTDFLRLADGTIKHALSIIYPLREQPGVRRFRVTQTEDLAVTVSIVRDELKQRVTTEDIERCVRKVVGDRIELNIEFPRDITVSGSGKYRYVISHAQPATVYPVAEVARE